MVKISGKRLAKRAGLELAHVLYRKSGDWYHVLKSFPAALLDENGYIRFDTQEDYDKFVYGGRNIGIHQNTETNTLRVDRGISAHLGYIQFGEVSIFPEEVPSCLSG